MFSSSLIFTRPDRRDHLPRQLRRMGDGCPDPLTGQRGIFLEDLQLRQDRGYVVRRAAHRSPGDLDAGLTVEGGGLIVMSESGSMAQSTARDSVTGLTVYPYRKEGPSDDASDHGAESLMSQVSQMSSEKGL